MTPDNIIKSIVRAVKSKEELSSVVCVYSDTRDIAQNPVCSFTLCMGLGRIKYSKNSDTNSPTFLTAIKLSLLAPCGAGGKRLTEVAMWVTEAVRESLSVKLIEVTEPRFIETSSTLYSDITVTVEDESFAENSSCEVYIDGIKEESVIAFDIKSEVTFEKQPELLNGYKLVKVGVKECSVKLTTRNFLNLRNVFVLTLTADGYSEIYGNCRVKKESCELSKWGNLSVTYEITAERYEGQHE